MEFSKHVLGPLPPVDRSTVAVKPRYPSVYEPLYFSYMVKLKVADAQGKEMNFFALASSLTAIGIVMSIQPAGAATGPVITEFSSGMNANSLPEAIVAGSDGNFWFTDAGITPAVGRITPAGIITEFTHGLNPGASPWAMTAGPDGNLWFTDAGTAPAIGRITPAGVVTEFSLGLNSGARPYGIAAGPDGNLWFTDDGSTLAVGRITPAGVITEFSQGIDGSPLLGTTAGADGNLWFSADVLVDRINTSTAAITKFQPTSFFGQILSLAAGTDGNVWFTVQGATPLPSEGIPTSPGVGLLGSVSPAGVIASFSRGLNIGSIPRAICGSPMPGRARPLAESHPSASSPNSPKGSLPEVFSPASRPLRTTPCGFPMPVPEPSAA
jgi:streptogramin lyase